MATAESVKGKIQGLIASSNAKTGNTDADLTTAVNALIAGFGSGGGGLAYDMGEFVLDADVQASDVGIPHALGETPEFVLVWTEAFNDRTTDNPMPYTTQTSLGYAFLGKLFGDLAQRYTSSISSPYAMYCGFTIPASSSEVAVSVPTSMAYGVGDDGGVYMPTEETIFLPRPANNVFWRAGVTYKYFVSKAWWNVGGVANAE